MIGSQRTIKQRIFKLEKDKEHISIERERLTDNVQKTQQKLAVDQQTLQYEILKLEKNLEQIPIERTRLNNRIAKARNNMKVLKTKLASIEKNKTLAKEAAASIKGRIDRVNSNTEELMQLRQSTLTGNADQLALLMYSNIIQQNISFAINLQRRIEELGKEINRYIDEEAVKTKEIDDLRIEISDLKIRRDQELPMKEESIKKNLLKSKAALEKTVKDAEIKVQELKVKRNQELTIKTENLKDQIETLKTKLSTLTPLEVNQPPISTPEPVNPAKIKIVALAVVLGGFLAVLAAFLTEFWVKNRARVMAASTESGKL